MLKSPSFWGGAILLIVAFVGATLIVFHGSSMPELPADAYFYLSKAENLVAGRGLTTYWNDGIDRKFFPLNSVAIAPFALLRDAFPNYWVMPVALYYLLTALVLAYLLHRIEPSGFVRFAALLFWLLNPNVALWHTVPYSEGLATLLLWSAVALCWRGWREISRERFAVAAGLAGLALISRAEAGLIVPLFGMVVLFTIVREGPRSVPWGRLAGGAILFALPMILWWISLPSSGEPIRLSYIEEFRSRFSWDQLVYNFRVLFTSVLFETHLHPPFAWMSMIQVIGDRIYMVSIGLALSGVMGRRARWICVTILAYQAIHSFWHYSYGRFNLIILPLVAFQFAMALRWTFSAWWKLGLATLIVINGDLLGYAGSPGRSLLAFLMIDGGIVLGLLQRMAWVEGGAAAVGNPDPQSGKGDSSGSVGPIPRNAMATPLARRWRPELGLLACAYAAALALVMLSLSNGAILRHKEFLKADSVAMKGLNRKVDAVVSRIGPSTACLTTVNFPLAYQVGSLTGERVWFSGGLSDFFPPAFDRSETEAFLREKNIHIILTSESPQSWLKRFNIPPSELSRLDLEKELPGEDLLRWDS